VPAASIQVADPVLFPSSDHDCNQITEQDRIKKPCSSNSIPRANTTTDFPYLYQLLHWCLCSSPSSVLQAPAQSRRRAPSSSSSLGSHKMVGSPCRGITTLIVALGEGVGCSADGAVSDITVISKGLEERISASLGELTGLLRLNLSHNLLSGGLPLELLSSNSIIILDVSFNRLNGGLRELQLSTPGRPLKVLNISSNLFTGQFPSTTWGVMNSLIALNASNNSFTSP
jgi:hypothetical protein